MTDPTNRQQQKLYLTKEARVKLRTLADERELQMSEVVEDMIIREKTETEKND